MTELFQQIKSRYGKFAVTGNHEFYAGIEQALAFTDQAGFRVLRGEGLTVDGVFNIVGGDDLASLRMGKANHKDEKTLLMSVPQNLFTIFLKHRPEIQQNTFGLFDVQLSGHTHHGQIFPFNFIIQWVYPMQNGLYRFVDGGFLYTHRGTGTWGPPMRFLTPPEVAIIDVVSDRG